MNGLSVKKGDIAVDLVFPVTRLDLGPFSFDPVKKLLGVSLGELFAPVLRRAVIRRAGGKGVGLDVYPVCFPVGEGIAIPAGHLGQFAFYNDAGLLRLTVPQSFEEQVVQRCKGVIVRGPERAVAGSGGGTNSMVWVELQAGMELRYSLGVLGEVGVEVATR